MHDRYGTFYSTSRVFTATCDLRQDEPDRDTEVNYRDHDSGCTRTYTRFSSYKKHVYVKHRDVFGVSTRERSPDLTDSNLSSHSYEEEERPEPYIATLLICRPYMADMTLHVIAPTLTLLPHSNVTAHPRA